MAHNEPVRVALVLGSGGARGYAHIGVIQVLRECGAQIAAIAGSSMGAVIGGLHATGTLDEYTERVLDLTQLEVFRMMDVALSGPGAIRGDRIYQQFADLIGDTQIEDLPIPFTAVAVDLLARREVWFQEGPLGTALRASTAIPTFFVPTFLNGRVLVDGGVLNPVPVAPVAAAHVDYIIAVSLAGHPDGVGGPVSESAHTAPESQWSDRLREAAGKWFDSDLVAAVRRRFPTEPLVTRRSRRGRDDDSLLDTTAVDTQSESDESNREVASERADKAASPEDALRAFDVMQSSYDIMQESLTRHRLAGYAPDLLLSVPKTAARTLDFHRAREMIDLGRSLTLEALPQLGIDVDDGPDSSAPPAG